MCLLILILCLCLNASQIYSKSYLLLVPNNSYLIEVLENQNGKDYQGKDSRIQGLEYFCSGLAWMTILSKNPYHSQWQKYTLFCVLFLVNNVLFLVKNALILEKLLILPPTDRFSNKVSSNLII